MCQSDSWRECGEGEKRPKTNRSAQRFDKHVKTNAPLLLIDGICDGFSKTPKITMRKEQNILVVKGHKGTEIPPGNTPILKKSVVWGIEKTPGAKPARTFIPRIVHLLVAGNPVSP